MQQQVETQFDVHFWYDALKIILACASLASFFFFAQTLFVVEVNYVLVVIATGL